MNALLFALDGQPTTWADVGFAAVIFGGIALILFVLAWSDR